MRTLPIEEIIEYVGDNIDVFHNKRLESIGKLKLNHLIDKKNPYLFKAKNITLAQDFVRALLDAYLSSQEETIFGEFLEGLAIFVCGKIYGGKKSSAEGIDLEFDKDGVRYLVAIKSGPKWGNSSSINKMKDNFKKAAKVLKTNAPGTGKVIFVNGCCYGRENQPDKGDYLKYCGQIFWHFISGQENLYTDIIEPLGYKAKEKNEVFFKEYSKTLNSFTAVFLENYCNEGAIDWDLIVAYNSAKIRPGKKKAIKKK